MKKLLFMFTTVLFFGSAVNHAADQVVPDSEAEATMLMSGGGGSGNQNYRNDFDDFASRCTIHDGNSCNY